MVVFVYGAVKEVEKKTDNGITSDIFSGLKFRNIGPALNSGRISDFAVNPSNPSEYYVAVAAGNVWKTVNHGITWTPIFDNYGAWSIADVEIDPNNPYVVWVGTGEYNSQRAIGYGDGIYRSEDGGRSFKNMGLKASEHIGRIIIDPRNSHVYVAVQGPLWGPGGERGLYKSTDNGKTWKAILTISENTGVSDIVMDPRNPDVLYASAYQRRRHVYTLIDGGPEGGIYKSIDAGATWNKVTSGLPSGDIGRIGLAISPVNPDIIYATVEAEKDKGGFFRSTNRGASWEKRSPYVSRSPQYYNRIVADPKNVDKVYSLDTNTMVTEDGGKTFRAVSNKNRHVDDHALWIDPTDNTHMLIGGDGGIYESYDNGENWGYKANLPVTQFYRVTVDNALPFYFVYGGTQDNNSVGGPSQTISADGIVNSDWFPTQGGDGFESQVDPENPDIIYAQSQHGGLVRYDKKTGDSVYIKPREGKGEAYRWNWNTPLIISPHSHTRLYMAANLLFRSDDRGNTWVKVSGDLTRQLDRNKLPVMGKIQSPEAIAKNASTSFFGNIVSLSESPKKEGLLYVGTDDGLIQVSENGGTQWTRYEKFLGVPDMTYVSCLLASLHDADTVYATFDGRKNNDFKPYVLVSKDRGKTWESITSDLPVRGTVYTIAQDHVKKDLLFVGTEFGVFVTIDGGKKWIQLKSGLPTTAVMDLDIQRRENDLALATFGRGFYILDNYTPLRDVTPEMLQKEAHIFPIKDALLFVEKGALYGQGETYFKAPNPERGATFTYYLKNSIKTLKDKRKEEEKKAKEKKVELDYPTMAQLRAEDEEQDPYILFTITDEKGQLVRRLKTAPSKGILRITWDLRYPSPTPPGRRSRRGGEETSGVVPVIPGKYFVSLSKCVGGVVTPIAGPQAFNVVPLNLMTLPVQDRKAMFEFQQKAAELARVVMGTTQALSKVEEKIELMRSALFNTPSASPQLFTELDSIEKQLREIFRALNGDPSMASRFENEPPSISDRLSDVLYSSVGTITDTTQTMKEQYRIVVEEFEPVYAKFKKLVEEDIKKLEVKMDEAGAPWTPDRLPELKK